MSQSYLVVNENGSALELRPFDRKWRWASLLQHGTPLTASDAGVMQIKLFDGDVDDARQSKNTRLVRDYHNRPAQEMPTTREDFFGAGSTGRGR